jgi:hypothetical protein
MTGPDTTSIVTPVLIATIPGLLAFLAAFHIHTHRPGRALRWALLSASISSGCWWFSGTLIAQVNPAIGGALLTFAVLTSFYGYYMIKQARVRDLHPGLAWIATGAERARLAHIYRVDTQRLDDIIDDIIDARARLDARARAAALRSDQVRLRGDQDRLRADQERIELHTRFAQQSPPLIYPYLRERPPRRQPPTEGE